MKLLFMSFEFFLCAEATEMIQRYFEFRISRRISRARHLGDTPTIVLSRMLCAAKRRLKALELRIEYLIFLEAIRKS